MGLQLLVQSLAIGSLQEILVSLYFSVLTHLYALNFEMALAFFS